MSLITVLISELPHLEHFIECAEKGWSPDSHKIAKAILYLDEQVKENRRLIEKILDILGIGVVISSAVTILGAEMANKFTFSTTNVVGIDEDGAAINRAPTSADKLSYALADPATGGTVLVNQDGISGSFDQGSAADGTAFVLNTLWNGNVIATTNGTWASENLTGATTVLGPEVSG